MNTQKMQRAKVRFDAREVPISDQFDDPYFSFQDGLAESRYVFVDGNNLKVRLRGGFSIAEIGFGSGLNFFATWQFWKSMKRVEENCAQKNCTEKSRTEKIYFTSFEAFPMTETDRVRALSGFEELGDFVDEFTKNFDGEVFENDIIRLEVVLGDINHKIAGAPISADAWFLDGFSPVKNPEAWGRELLLEVGRKTRMGGTFATYSAAGHVREKLTQAGFDVIKVKGFGHKRHMSKGTKIIDKA